MIHGLCVYWMSAKMLYQKYNAHHPAGSLRVVMHCCQLKRKDIAKLTYEIWQVSATAVRVVTTYIPAPVIKTFPLV